METQKSTPLIADCNLKIHTEYNYFPYRYIRICLRNGARPEASMVTWWAQYVLQHWNSLLLYFRRADVYCTEGGSVGQTGRTERQASCHLKGFRGLKRRDEHSPIWSFAWSGIFPRSPLLSSLGDRLSSPRSSPLRVIVSCCPVLFSPLLRSLEELWLSNPRVPVSGFCCLVSLSSPRPLVASKVVGDESEASGVRLLANSVFAGGLGASGPLAFDLSAIPALRRCRFS